MEKESKSFKGVLWRDHIFCKIHFFDNFKIKRLLFLKWHLIFDGPCEHLWKSNQKNIFILLIFLLKSIPCWLTSAKLHHWGHTNTVPTHTMFVWAMFVWAEALVIYKPRLVYFLPHFSLPLIIYIVEWLVLYTIYVLNKEIQ